MFYGITSKKSMKQQTIFKATFIIVLYLLPSATQRYIELFQVLTQPVYQIRFPEVFHPAKKISVIHFSFHLAETVEQYFQFVFGIFL